MKIVLKRDGSRENYDEVKIIRVVTAAGLRPDQAQKLAKKVTLWVDNLRQPEVSTLQIRDKVIEGLKKVNDNAAGLFIWYEHTKDK